MIYSIAHRLLNNKVLSKTLKLSIVSMFSNALSFFIPIYIGYRFSISTQTDNFFLSLSVMTFISVIFAEALRSTSIPFLRKYLNQKFYMDRFVSTVFFKFILIGGCIVVSVSCIALGIYLLGKNELLLFILLFSPFLLFTILSAFLTGVLNSSEKYYLAELSPIFRSIIILTVVMLLGESLGVQSIIIGYIIGEMLRFVFLFQSVKKLCGISISHKKIKSSTSTAFLRSSRFQIFSSGISSAYPLIDRWAASFLVLGSVSLIEYGDRLFMFFNVILNAFMVIILSKWSAEFTSHSVTFKRIKTTMGVTLALTISLALLIFLCKDIITFYLYPKLSPYETKAIATILMINMTGFIFNALNQILNRALIVNKLNKAIFKVSLIKICFNVAFTYLLSTWLGLYGIVIATLLVHVIGLILNYLVLNKWIFGHDK